MFQKAVFCRKRQDTVLLVFCFIQTLLASREGRSNLDGPIQTPFCNTGKEPSQSKTTNVLSLVYYYDSSVWSTGPVLILLPNASSCSTRFLVLRIFFGDATGGRTAVVCYSETCTVPTNVPSTIRSTLWYQGPPCPLSTT